MARARLPVKLTPSLPWGNFAPSSDMRPYGASMIRRILFASGVLALASWTSPAQAGSVGAFGLGGFHSGIALGENLDDEDSTNDTGLWGDGGAGIEVTLGPSGGRLLGRGRGAWNVIVSPDPDVPLFHTGVFSFGLSVELLPNLDSPVGLYGAVDVGVSGLALYHQERLLVTAGPGLRVRVGKRAHAFVEAAYLLEVRDAVWQGMRASGGVRFFLD